jgi:hypothetical protein
LLHQLKWPGLSKRGIKVVKIRQVKKMINWIGFYFERNKYVEGTSSGKSDYTKNPDLWIANFNSGQNFGTP